MDSNEISTGIKKVINPNSGQDVVIYTPDGISSQQIQHLLDSSYSQSKCKEHENCEAIHFLATFISLGINNHLFGVKDMQIGWTEQDYSHLCDLIASLSLEVDHILNGSERIIH